MDVHSHELRQKLAARWVTLLIMMQCADIGTRLIVAIKVDRDDPSCYDGRHLPQRGLSESLDRST